MLIYHRMLFFILTSIFGCAMVDLASTSPSLVPLNAAQLTATSSKNTTAAAVGISLNLNSSLPGDTIDPRLTYSTKFGIGNLDRRSCYMNTLEALLDLPSKGWARKLPETEYSIPGYSGIRIRLVPYEDSTLMQYRHAVWGLYLAIQEMMANEFKVCVLTLNWSFIVGGTPHVIGFVAILGTSASGIGNGNLPEDSLELPQSPAQGESLNTGDAFSLVSRIAGNSASSASDPKSPNLRVDTTFQTGAPLATDTVFHTILAGMILLAAQPQDQAIQAAGYIKDSLSGLRLRWDASFQGKDFTYRYAMLGLAALPVYMYAQDRFSPARFVFYVDEMEAGRGVIYQSGGGGEGV